MAGLTRGTRRREARRPSWSERRDGDVCDRGRGCRDRHDTGAVIVGRVARGDDHRGA